MDPYNKYMAIYVNDKEEDGTMIDWNLRYYGNQTEYLTNKVGPDHLNHILILAKMPITNSLGAGLTKETKDLADNCSLISDESALDLATKISDESK